MLKSRLHREGRPEPREAAREDSAKRPELREGFLKLDTHRFLMNPENTIQGVGRSSPRLNLSGVRPYRSYARNDSKRAGTETRPYNERPYVRVGFLR